MRAIFQQKKHLIALLMLATAAAPLAHLSWQGEVVGLLADDTVHLLLADYFRHIRINCAKAQLIEG